MPGTVLVPNMCIGADMPETGLLMERDAGGVRQGNARKGRAKSLRAQDIE